MAHDINFPSAIDDFEEVVDETTPGSGTKWLAAYFNPILSSIATMQLHYGVNPMSLQAFAEDVEHTQGLVWGWLGGSIRYDNTVRAIATGTINLTDDATNYVFYDWADNAVEVNTTGFPSGAYLPIAEIVTASSAITGTWASRDKRSILQLGSTGGASAHSDLSELAYADAGHTGFEPTVTKGALTVSTVASTAAVLTVTGGAGAVIGAGAKITINKADTDHDGYLSSTDWDTFNGKAASGANSDITSLSGLTTPLSVAQGGTGSATAIIEDSISDGVTTKAPSENAVYDALALKSPLASPTFTGTVTTPAIKITTGAGAGKFLKSDADGDATWESSAASGYSYPMDFRLTLETGVPVSTTAQTAKTTLYLTPYTGNQIALYYDSAWVIYSVSEMSISLSGLTASTPYDVWCYSDSGTPTLELLAWTNATTRATALTRQDGVYAKTGATTRRYIGTVYINASGGQTDDSPGGTDTEAKRYVWNYYNRVPREFSLKISTASWSYSTASWRASNAASTNKVSFVIGVREDAVTACLSQFVSNNGLIAIGLDSAASAASSNGYVSVDGTVTVTVPYNVSCIGYHYLQSIEYAVTGTVTYYGSGNYAFTGTILC